MKTQIENLREFVCPKCGGKHFGRDTAKIDGVVQCLPTVRCHTPGCGWRGDWSSAAAAEIMGLKIRPGEPDDLTIAQLIHQRADLLAALESLVLVVGLTAFKYEEERTVLQQAVNNARVAIQSVKGNAQ